MEWIMAADEKSLSVKCLMCHRQIKTNNVSAFSLSKQHGYSSQPVLSALKSHVPGSSNANGKIDFDHTTSFEHFFKVYLVFLKEKLSLTISDLMQAKNPWKVVTTVARKPQFSSAFIQEYSTFGVHE